MNCQSSAANPRLGELRWRTWMKENRRGVLLLKPEEERVLFFFSASAVFKLSFSFRFSFRSIWRKKSRCACVLRLGLGASFNLVQSSLHRRVSLSFLYFNFYFTVASHSVQKHFRRLHSWSQHLNFLNLPSMWCKRQTVQRFLPWPPTSSSPLQVCACVSIVSRDFCIKLYHFSASSQGR